MSLRLPEEEYNLLKHSILVRDGWKCRHCGFRNNLAIHHVVFRSEQGPDETWNLAVLCTTCHDAIHEHNLTIWADDQEVGADGPLEFTTHNGWRPS